MVQCFFPGPHELSIMLRGECCHEFVACRAQAGVGIRDLSHATAAFWRKLNIQPTRCHAGRNLQHLDEELLRLVARDIPNRTAPLVRRDKDAVTLRHATGTDDEVGRPSVGPFCFPHGAKEWEDLFWRGTQSQRVCMRCSIWFSDGHRRSNTRPQWRGTAVAQMQSGASLHPSSMAVGFWSLGRVTDARCPANKSPAAK
jgi:hypothetical protein